LPLTRSCPAPSQRFCSPHGLLCQQGSIAQDTTRHQLRLVKLGHSQDLLLLFFAKSNQIFSFPFQMKNNTENGLQIQLYISVFHSFKSSLSAVQLKLSPWSTHIGVSKPLGGGGGGNAFDFFALQFLFCFGCLSFSVVIDAILFSI